MKKAWILVLTLIVLPIVNAAGRTFELDFNAKEAYPLIMEKGDRVLFEYGGYNHTIILDDVKKNTTELDIFLFLEAGLHTPDYVSINNQYSTRLDFNKDGRRELAVEYVASNSTTKKAAIIFKKLEAWDDNIKLTPFWETKGDGRTDWTTSKTIYYVLG